MAYSRTLSGEIWSVFLASIEVLIVVSDFRTLGVYRLSDYFGGESFSQTPVATVWKETEPAKGAPWFYLGAGFGAIVLVLVAKIFLHPAGDFAALGHAFYWLLSLIAFLVPVALFSIADLKRQLVIDYPTHPKTVRTVKFGFLIFGLAASLFQVYELATELSKLLNVG
jgi:hypothetical protein